VRQAVERKTQEVERRVQGGRHRAGV
jgi:hypothetical protein